MKPRIVWLGHASFRIDTDKGAIFTDPWKLKDPKKAEIVLITHSHFDHFSEEDIDSVSKGDTVLVGPADVAGKRKGVVMMRAGDKKRFKGVLIEAHRAYNPKKEFHPRSNNWLGYVVDIEGFRIYLAGDTDVIPEMREVKNIDVALLPVGGTYTMNPSEAAEAASIIGAKKAIPMHWGDIVGDESNAREFSRLADCSVEILKKS